MNTITVPDAFGILTEPATLKIQRVLPGPIERVWSYLTESDMRRQWLASGEMTPERDSPFELVWHNDELTDPPGQRPEGFGEEHRAQCRIVEFDAPRKLVFVWGGNGTVSIELKQYGDEILLTLIHERVPDRNMSVMVGAGWHMHLDVLVACITGEKTEPFWDGWKRLKAEYERRVPA